MKITELIAKAITDVHNGSNWTEVTMESSLEELGWEDAVAVTPASPNSIAMLVHHITFWNRVVALRGLGKETQIDIDNGFITPQIKNDKDWKALVKDNILSAKELAAVITAFDETKLHLPVIKNHSSAYSNFQGQAEHVHYHLGQIVAIRKLVEQGY